MIMDAGLLTVTSVRENNNQHTGSESAVSAPHRNADTLMLMLGGREKNFLKKSEKTPPFPRFGGRPQLISGSSEHGDPLRPRREETSGSLLVEVGD